MLEAQTVPFSAPFSTPDSLEVPSSPPLKTPVGNPFAPLDTFARRHLGPQPEDIATAVTFLASSDSSWITGETLLIAGGFR